MGEQELGLARLMSELVPGSPPCTGQCQVWPWVSAKVAQTCAGHKVSHMGVCREDCASCPRAPTSPPVWSGALVCLNCIHGCAVQDNLNLQGWITIFPQLQIPLGPTPAGRQGRAARCPCAGSCQVPLDRAVVWAPLLPRCTARKRQGVHSRNAHRADAPNGLPVSS